VNITDCTNELQETLSKASAAASPDTLSYTARHSIKKYWDTNVDEAKKRISEQLQNPDIKLTPNFEANFLALKASKESDENFQKNLGNYTRAYFDSLADNLELNKFKEDDMLYEGFAEAVTKGEIAFRVVEQLTGNARYGQILIDDGVFVIQVRRAFNL
jgi:hypothetical protein